MIRLILILSALVLFVPATYGAEMANDFFVFDNGAGRGSWSPERQAKTLAELGYAGIGYSGTEALTERLAAFERHGVRVFNIYVPCYVDREEAYGADLVEAISALEGTGVTIWLTVQGRAADDTRAVEVVGEIADFAAASGVEVALYPHAGFYVDDIRDALRIANKVNRDNLGVTFNLCHELKAGNEEDFYALIEEAGDKLLLVSINGADHEGGWDKLIRRLGEGEFDLMALLRKLVSVDYTGPIGLQCYQVPGDTDANLKHNIAEWRRIVESISADEN